MLFFDERKISVENAADIHWSSCHNLPYNSDVVCQRKFIVQQCLLIHFIFYCPTIFFKTYTERINVYYFYNDPDTDMSAIHM